MRQTIRIVSFVMLLLAGGCGGSGAVPDMLSAPSTTGPAQCLNQGFRGATLGSTVCPGTSTCLCTGSDICCLQGVDSPKGVCEPAGYCRTFALQCDGPEDCRGAGSDGGVTSNPPRVCCLDESIGLTGGGSECRPVSACTGKILCRSDDDCAAVTPTLPVCRPVDYGTPGVEDRGLDGLIGYCAKS